MLENPQNIKTKNIKTTYSSTPKENEALGQERKKHEQRKREREREIQRRLVVNSFKGCARLFGFNKIDFVGK